MMHKSPEEMSWDLPDLQRGFGRVSLMDCHGSIPRCHPAGALRPCRHASHASGLQEVPYSRRLVLPWDRAQAYLLVGGESNCGEWWVEEACGWLQGRNLIDRGKLMSRGFA